MVLNVPSAMEHDINFIIAIFVHNPTRQVPDGMPLFVQLLGLVCIVRPACKVDVHLPYARRLGWTFDYLFNKVSVEFAHVRG
jgi:hypothetical protein